jgi:hypothetical protein
MEMMGLGTLMGANAAKMTQKKLDEIVRMPELDVGNAYGQAIGAINANQAGAEGVARRTNQFNQGQINDVLEQGVPGFSEMQRRRVKQATDLLGGGIPEDVQRQVYRSSAGRALQGGFSGSPAGRNLTARDFGRTSLDMIDRGNQMTGSILSSTPLARTQGSNDILNMSGGDFAKLRSNERTEKMSAMRDRAIAPGATAVGGQGLQQMGKSLMEMAGSMGGAAMGGGM